MSTYLERRLPPGSKFLKQETARERGVNTCYITSAVNAAIALEVIGIRKAIQAHERIVSELMQIPRLWHESFLNVDSTDETIPAVIQSHIPRICLGFRPNNGPRIYKEGWSFEAVQNGLIEGHKFVAIVRAKSHAYAITQAYGDCLAYIDPLNPNTRHLTQPRRFPKLLAPNEYGYGYGSDKVEVTLVSRK